ncbi:MAG TPA: hypothetical protein VFN56_02130 [Candidatus Saccharimonadales bacterium]|nr:hypothetical protein [Candidatus Saccharimonadales bacterium]
MTKWLEYTLVLSGAIVCTLAGFMVAAVADGPSSSPHYQLNESTIGGGGLVQSESTNFQSREAIGETAVGSSSSTNYQTNSGYVTTGAPALSFGLNNANAAFNDFSPNAAATTTASFSVSDYTSYGYVVQVLGHPPTLGTHTISAMATTGPSTPGTEQFGINLVANTSPATFGANPDHGQFGVGSAATNYNTANNFRYVEGETIASAPKSSGVTTYTISYIVNVTTLTPGGSYTSDQQLVCTGTY